MGKLVGYAYHPADGSKKEIYEGFSWWCLLFCVFWYVYKDIYKWAFISFGAAIVTGGISWLVFPFFANAQYADHLRKQGYLDMKQQREKDLDKNMIKNEINIGIAVEIRKLSELRDEGIITGD